MTSRIKSKGISHVYMSRNMTKPTILPVRPAKTQGQPGHPSSLIWVFAVRMKKAWALSYPLSAQRRLWSDWADAQADLSLRWMHSHFVGFVVRRLEYIVRSAFYTQPTEALDTDPEILFFPIFLIKTHTFSTIYSGCTFWPLYYNNPCDTKCTYLYIIIYNMHVVSFN